MWGCEGLRVYLSEGAAFDERELGERSFGFGFFLFEEGLKLSFKGRKLLFHFMKLILTSEQIIECDSCLLSTYSTYSSSLSLQTALHCRLGAAFPNAASPSSQNCVRILRPCTSV